MLKLRSYIGAGKIRMLYGNVPSKHWQEGCELVSIRLSEKYNCPQTLFKRVRKVIT